MSLLLNWFSDWGLAIKNGLGQTWLIVLIVAMTFWALCLFQSVIRASINKTKLKIKWLSLIWLVILVLFIVWFITLL